MPGARPRGGVAISACGVSTVQTAPVRCRGALQVVFIAQATDADQQRAREAAENFRVRVYRELAWLSEAIQVIAGGADTQILTGVSLFFLMDVVFMGDAFTTRSVLTGEVGSGKTTLFNLLNGFTRPDGGEHGRGVHRCVLHLRNQHRRHARGRERRDVCPGERVRNPIGSMQGCFQLSVDQLVAQTGLPVPRILSTLSVLEMRRIIRECGPCTLTPEKRRSTN